MLRAVQDDMDESEGEFYVPRRSASHLLGLIATSKVRCLLLEACIPRP